MPMSPRRCCRASRFCPRDGKSFQGKVVAKKVSKSKAIVPSGEERRYSVGDAVRVRAGVVDPDFPDLPLSGWAGEIVDIERANPPVYLVEWTPETLQRITPVYSVRCDREGKDPRVTLLGGKDLVLDTGGPLVIAQPTRLRPAPLDKDDPQDRIRGIFKLTSDDPLPKVDESSLRRFHEHFKKKLKVPVAATCSGAPLSQKPATILRLLPFAETNTEHGLLVRVEQGDEVGTGPLYDISLLSQNAVSEDIDAYSEWFFQDKDDEDEEDYEDYEEESQVDKPRVHVGSVRHSVEVEAQEPDDAEYNIGRIALTCIMLAALAGALLWVHEWAMVMAQWGAGLLGLFGGIYGSRIRFVTRIGQSALLTGFGLTLLNGLQLAVIGGTIGILLLSYSWAIPGTLAGILVGVVLSACGVRNHSTFFLGVLGTYIGAVVYAFTLGANEALAGSLYGAGFGLVSFVIGYVGTSWLNSRIRSPRE